MGGQGVGMPLSPRAPTTPRVEGNPKPFGLVWDWLGVVFPWDFGDLAVGINIWLWVKIKPTGDRRF